MSSSFRRRTTTSSERRRQRTTSLRPARRSGGPGSRTARDRRTAVPRTWARQTVQACGTSAPRSRSRCTRLRSAQARAPAPAVLVKATAAAQDRPAVQSLDLAREPGSSRAQRPSPPSAVSAYLHTRPWISRRRKEQREHDVFRASFALWAPFLLSLIEDSPHRHPPTDSANDDPRRT